MHTKIQLKLVLVLLCIFSGCSKKNDGSLKVVNIFTDHMVLQRDQKILVRGFSKPNSKVKVSLHWWQTYSTKAKPDGYWQVFIGPFAAGGPNKLKISSQGNTIELKDILVGDVWLAAGQSNMCWQVRYSSNPFGDIMEGKHYKFIRFLRNHTKPQKSPLDSIDGSWEFSDAASIGNFSAVAFSFAKNLYKERKIPIGIIQACADNISISSLMSKESLEEFPELKKQIQDENFPVQHWVIGDFTLEPQYLGFNGILSLSDINIPVATWLNSFRLSPFRNASNQFLVLKNDLRPQNQIKTRLLAQDSSEEKIKEFLAHLNQSFITIDQTSLAISNWQHLVIVEKNYPTVVYNSLVAPFIDFPIKGVIWYQGESDISNYQNYPKLFKALVIDWRKKWQQKNLPFISVQLHDFKTENAEDLKQFQTMQMDLANSISHHYVISGKGFESTELDVHPKNKEIVGKNLATKATEIN